MKELPAGCLQHRLDTIRSRACTCRCVEPTRVDNVNDTAVVPGDLPEQPLMILGTGWSHRRTGDRIEGKGSSRPHQQAVESARKIRRAQRAREVRCITEKHG